MSEAILAATDAERKAFVRGFNAETIRTHRSKYVKAHGKEAMGNFEHQAVSGRAYMSRDEHDGLLAASYMLWLSGGELPSF